MRPHSGSAQSDSYEPSISKIPYEIWRTIFELAVCNIPGIFETCDIDAIIPFARENEPSGIYKSTTTTLKNRRALYSVCTSWYPPGRDIFYEHIELHDARSVKLLSDCLDAIRSDRGRLLPTDSTKRLDVYLNFQFQMDMESWPAEKQNVIRCLKNIVLSCPRLSVFSFVAVTHVVPELESVLSTLLTAAPSLKRLEVYVPFNVESTLSLLHRLHHAQSLQVLSISPATLKLHNPLQLPKVHTLILRYPRRDHLSETNERSWASNGRHTVHFPSLRTCAVFVDPSCPGADISSLAKPIQRRVKHLYSCITDPGGFRLYPDLETTGISYIDFCRYHPDALPIATGIESILISFRGEPQNSLPLNYVEHNLQRLSTVTWFPGLQQMRICLPSIPDQDGENFPVPLLSIPERIVWNRRLEKLSQRGVSFEVATTDEWWTTSEWRKASAREASDALNRAKVLRGIRG